MDNIKNIIAIVIFAIIFVLVVLLFKNVATPDKNESSYTYTNTVVQENITENYGGSYNE